MMKKGIAKFTAFCMAAGLTFGGTGVVSMATGTELSLVGLGSTVNVSAVQNDTETEAQAVDADTSADTDAQSVDTSADAAADTYADVQDVQTEETEATPVLDTSMVETTGFAQCEAYVNIRSSADTEGEVIGSLANNAAVYILGVDENGWYRVRSGNVEGYVASQYIATGAAAEAISSDVGYHVAEVGAEVLNVRSEPSADSEIVATVTNTQEVEVVEDCGEWLKVAVDADCYGYVSVEYVNAEMQYKVAETVEEKQDRLDAEYQAYLDAQAAEQAQAEAEYQAYLDQQAAEQAQAEAEYQAYLDAQAAADAAAQETTDAQAQAEAEYQAYLDAQAAADQATQQADEQAAIDAANAAQEQYQQYLNAQAQADAQAQAKADAEAAANQAQNDAQQAQDNADAYEDYTDNTYQDDTSYDDSSSDDGSYDDSSSSDDGSYDDSSSSDDGSYDDSSSAGSDDSSYSSTGSEIVNFAVQFVGNPYVWGGTSLTNGADCSGFTQSVFANFGISLPRTAAEQCGSGTPVDLGSIQPGDLLFYDGGSGIGHVSIYMGNGQVVHASNASTGITISSYGYRTPCAARRYF